MEKTDLVIHTLIAELEKPAPVDPKIVQRFVEIGAPSVHSLIVALKRECTWMNAAEVLSHMGEIAVMPLVLHPSSVDGLSNIG